MRFRDPELLQKTVSDTQKTVSDTQKTVSDTQKMASDTYKILTTGRWICTRCGSSVPPETKVCRCGWEIFTPELDPDWLSEALKKDAERVRSRMRGGR